MALEVQTLSLDSPDHRDELVALGTQDRSISRRSLTVGTGSLFPEDPRNSSRGEDRSHHSRVVFSALPVRFFQCAEHSHLIDSL